MSLSASENVDKQQKSSDYSDEYGDDAQQEDYASGPESEYFGPLQPVKSADEQKVYQVPQGGWHEKLVQNLEEDPSPSSTSGSTAEPTKQVAEASVLSTAFVILLILVIISCCVLPCCYYLIYDPAVAKGFRSLYKGARKRAKDALGVDVDTPPPYKKFTNETRRGSVEKGKEKERRNHKSKRKSRHGHGRMIEIPIPSDDSVDITITTTDGCDSDDEGCKKGLIWSELDIVSDGCDLCEESGDEEETDCPFEPIQPIHRTEEKHHKKHSNHRSHHNDKHGFRNSYNDYHQLSSQAEQDIFSRYNDAIDNSYKEIPIVHDQRRKSHEPQPNRFNQNYPLTIPVPVSNADEQDVLDRLHKSVAHDLDFKKSKKYDAMIRDWKWKNASLTEAKATKSGLGSPPPPRKNHSNSFDIGSSDKTYR